METIQQEFVEQTIDRFWETVPPTWNRIRGRIRATAAERFGITVEQFHILRHIRKGMNSVSELAEEKQISRSAISQAVETLVEKGLITRHQDQQDRRFVQLALTESGSTLLNEVFQQNRAWMREKLAALSTEELEQLMGGMAILRKTFEES